MTKRERRRLTGARTQPPLLRQLVKQPAYALVLMDAGGTILHVSPEAALIMGYPAGDLRGIDVFTLIHPEDQERMRVVLAGLKARPGATVAAEYRCLRKNGSWWWAGTRATNLLEDSSVHAIIATYRDITEKKDEEEARRAAEEALRTSEALGRLILATAYHAFISIDARGVITEWNTAAEFTFGWSRPEVIGRALADVIIPPRFREQHAMGLRRFADTGEAHVLGRRLEFTALHRNGHEFPVELTISVLRQDGTYSFHAFVADLTPRKKLEAALRDREARLRSVVESTFDGIIFVSPDCQVGSVNRRAEEILALGSFSAEGAALAAVLDHVGLREQDRQALAAACRSLLDGGEQDHAGDLEVPGRRQIIHWVARAARDTSGALTGITFTLRDVTQDREISRMKSEFVSFVTHQLRAPLAGIKWLLELAQDAQTSDDARMYIQDVREVNERLVHLVNDLLDLSRLEEGRLPVEAQLTDLGELTRSVLDELGPLVRDRGHQVSVIGASEIPPVPSDPRLLRQVFTNLISNAAKYTLADGIIRIRMHRDGDAVCWTVEDNGIGIPAQALSRLFQKFYRAENALNVDPDGTGLGLALARLIMERLGGRLWCESQEGRGATFFCVLPLAGRREAGGAAAQTRFDH